MISTLRLFSLNRFPMEASTAWYLNDLGEYRGKQELYTQQSPQRLKALRESAIIESAVSSNRIEGVTIDPNRVRDILVAPKPLFRDRDEEEVRGYRDALTLIHKDAALLPICNETICRLHALTRGQIWDAGKYKERDGDIIERYPDGSERVRFRTIPAAQTQDAMDTLIADWQQCLEERWLPPLIALAAFNLDFLCIHPFNDGNGRMSRLLTLLLFYKAGYIVGKYVSMEMLIEKTKETYYEALQASSTGWHEGENSYEPFVKYYLGIMLKAYNEFESRVEHLKHRSLSKPDRIKAVIDNKVGKITKKEIMELCPDISKITVERTLTNLVKSGYIAKVGAGPSTGYVRV